MSIETFVKYYLYGLQTLINLKKQVNMELEMQYTYKNVSISMIKDNTQPSGKKTKNILVIFHKEAINWKVFNLHSKYGQFLTFLTPLQATKRFMNMVNKINKDRIEINILKPLN